MARIKLGPVVTDIAGSIGCLTIQRNRFGITARQKPLPLYSQTSAQYNLRRKIAYIQHEWQNLTDAQRLQWNRFLDFSGQTIRRDRSVRLSGQTLYIKYQLFHILANQSLFTTISYVPLPDLALPTAINISGAYYYLHFDSSVVPEEYFFQFHCTNPRPQSRSFSPRGLRFMLITWTSGTNFNFKPAYLNAFGVGFSIGDFVHYSIQYFSILSPVFSGKFTGIFEITAP